MDKICMNCKHWDGRSHVKWGDCDLLEGDNYSADGADDKVSFSEYLSVGRNFGCIHFEAEPTETKWKYLPGA